MRANTPLAVESGALMKAREGDIVDPLTPHGIEKIEIVEIDTTLNL